MINGDRINIASEEPIEMYGLLLNSYVHSIIIGLNAKSGSFIIDKFPLQAVNSTFKEVSEPILKIMSKIGDSQNTISKIWPSKNGQFCPQKLLTSLYFFLILFCF